MMKVTNDFYRQFEELNNKLDSLLKENKDLRREFKQEKEDLKATIKEKDELIEKLLNEIDRLKNQINKNQLIQGRKKVEPIYIILEKRQIRKSEDKKVIKDIVLLKMKLKR